VLGALLRTWCFRSLGKSFTFELSIQPSHTLVTSGPYSLVRHPSYTGIYLTLLGATIVGLAPGTWLRKRWLNEVVCLLPRSSSYCERVTLGLGHFIVYALACFWLIKVTYALRSTNIRMRIEDMELHKVFGERWEEYAKKVQWKLLPGVY